MSLWQRPHVWLVMKKLAGMIPLTFVFADEGKNGLEGPAPSPSMLTGGHLGFTMRYAPALGPALLHHERGRPAGRGQQHDHRNGMGRPEPLPSRAAPHLTAAIASASSVPVLTTAMCVRSSQR